MVPTAFTDTEHAHPDDLAALRAAFAAVDVGPALGWDGVRDFERAQGVVLPEPYRAFVAEVADGCQGGPPEYGLLPVSALPGDWDSGADRDLGRAFPLTDAWMWHGDPRPAEEKDPVIDAV